MKTSLVCALAVSVLAGHVSPTPAAEFDRSRIRKLAIAVADIPPEIGVSIKTSTTETLARIQEAAEGEMRRHLSAAGPRQQLIAALQAELAAGGFEAIVLAQTEVPNSADARPQYRAQGRDMEAVLEVSIRTLRMSGAGRNNIMTRGSNELLANLLILGLARLIGVTDQAVLRQFPVFYRSGYAPLEDWMAEQGKHVQVAISAAGRQLAAEIVDRTLRDYEPAPLPVDSKGQGSPDPFPPTQRGSIEQSAPAPSPDPKDLSRHDSDYPIHALRPLRLQPVGANPFRARIGGRPTYGSTLTPSKAETIRPTLEWERFPRGYDWAPEKTDAPRIASVTYELRLWSSILRYAQGRSDLIFRERVIYERAGLPAPIHHLETDLDPCEVYFWTVRSRFSLDGRERVTPWMTYRGSTIAFATPTKPGQACVYGN